MKLRLLLLPLLTAWSAGALANGRPNFVIMMTDDQRADAMSIAGNRMLKTPNLDRIAREGVRFRNMFVTNALCAPSRATLLTGLYSHSHGVVDNRMRQIKPEQPILSDLLREAGYEVAFCGKSHMGGALRERKWDYYFGYRGQGRYHNPLIAEGVDGTDKPYPGYMDDVVTDKAVEWLKRKREKPFCLFLFFKAPHRSWERATRHADLFKDDVVPKPHAWDEFEKGYPGKPSSFADADNKIGNAPDVMSLEKMVKDINATVTAVDENVGKVFEALKKTGRLNDTAMLFTSDNGFFHGEWRLYDKRLMHEPSIRVPLLVRYPDRFRPNQTREQMAINIDIAPTVLDLAQIPVPRWMHGRSLVPVLSNSKAGFRKDWLYEYYEYPADHKVKPHRGVRTDRWKLIHYYEAPEEFELYDLKKDPGEMNNLYGKPGSEKTVTDLRRRIDELRRESGDLGTVTPAESVIRQPSAVISQRPNDRPTQRPEPRIPDSVEVTRDVVYGTGGGRALRMHILKPRNPPKEPMPVIVWIHGGAWRAGSRDSGIGMLSPLVERGYFGASIEYRLSGEAQFPAQIEDCKAAIRFLRAKAGEYRIDPDRIGVWGSSAGGHLVALLGTSGGVKELEGIGGSADKSSRVNAVVDFFGPTDFTKMADFPSNIDHNAPQSPESLLIGGPVQQNKEKAAKANPISYVTPDDPPFLIMHGDKDPLVPLNQSELLFAALKKAGVEAEFEVVRGAGHGFGGPEIHAKVLAFLDRHLKGPRPQKSNSGVIESWSGGPHYSTTPTLHYSSQFQG